MLFVIFFSFDLEPPDSLSTHQQHRIVAPLAQWPLFATMEDKRTFSLDVQNTAPPDEIEAHAETIRYDHTKRKLKPRHIQLIGIAGTIGTA